MTLGRCVAYCHAWLKKLISLQALGSVLSAFGALWLTVQIVTFFFAGTKWPDTIRNSWMWFGLAGVGIAVWMCRPSLVVSHKLNGRDVIIEIAIGDVFAYPGALIIGSNTTFDTRISKELISAKSVQGHFTKLFYGDETQLDRELSAGLAGIESLNLPGHRVGKAERYPMGTCVRLDPQQRRAYFVAIANIKEPLIKFSCFHRPCG